MDFFSFINLMNEHEFLLNISLKSSLNTLLQLRINVLQTRNLEITMVINSPIRFEF